MIKYWVSFGLDSEYGRLLRRKYHSGVRCSGCGFARKISNLEVKRSSDKQMLFEVNRGTEHSWICFVTESGKVYDVD